MQYVPTHFHRNHAQRVFFFDLLRNMVRMTGFIQHNVLRERRLAQRATLNLLLLAVLDVVRRRRRRRRDAVVSA